MALDTITGAGTQSSTGSPQNVGGSNISPATTGRFQPGTSSSLLNSTKGISLDSSALTVVDLNSSSSSMTQAQTAPPAKPHHINSVALGFFVGLALVAVIVFISMTKSAKNTT